MAKFNLTGSKIVAELKKEFNEAFGSKLKVYNKNKIAEDTATLGELGLKADNEFECRANRTAGSFIAAFAEMGLKVKIYTPDEWVAVLNGLTLESTGKVKKNATKADMEGMEGYQREEKEQSEDVSDGSNFLLIDKLRDDIIIEDDDNVYYDAENDDEDSIDEFFRILEELSAEDEMEKIRNLEFANEQELVDYLDNDPDDIDLAYKLICAAYMKWYGYTEDDEFYVNCTTYYFNDNKDFHYERETDIDFG